MIDDKDVDEAVHWLMNSADIIATAKATLVYLEEYRKSLKAQIMKEYGDMSVSAQEREAYASERMIEHIKAIQKATYNYETHLNSVSRSKLLLVILIIIHL